MSEKDTRIIPPGQPGSPFFEPSGSMRGPGEIDFGPDYFRDPAAVAAALESLANHRIGHGGTDLTQGLADVLIGFEKVPGDRFDRYTFVITDGEPQASLHEAHGDVLSVLMRQAGLFHFICLDDPAISDLSQIAAHDRQRPQEDGVLTADEIGRLPSCQRAASEMFGITGNGLAPVPSASELVTRICSTVDGVAEPALTDQCLDCGGCDKK